MEISTPYFSQFGVFFPTVEAGWKETQAIGLSTENAAQAFFNTAFVFLFRLGVDLGDFSGREAILFEEFDQIKVFLAESPRL